MPQIVPAVVGAFVKFGTVVASKGLISGLVGTALGKFIISTAISVGLSILTRPRIDLSEQDTPGQELKVRFQTDHPITVLVGQTATAGHCVWANSRGTDNRYLERIFVLSDYACDGFVKLYGDGEELTLSGDPTAAWVTCTSKYQDKDNNDMLSVRVYLGSEDQAADSELIAAYGDLDSNFRLRGKTYAIVRCDYDPEFAFSGGEPQLLWEMKGAPVFDPREASHDAADPDTWAWSDNPALIAAQYYQGWTRAGKTILGAGWDRSRIPEADLIAAANECDEEVSLKAGGTEKRYRAGGPLYSSRSHRGNIEKLLLAMDGEVDDTAGEVRFLPGVERATVKEIKWNDILSASTLELDPELDPAEGINKVLSRHPDPANQYQIVELPERTSATYVTEDGGADLTLDTAFDLVNSSTQGQRLGKRLLERARAQRRLSLTVRLKYVVLEKGDRVTLDATLRERLRLPETQWRVEQRPAVSLQRDEQGLQVNLVLREHPDAIGDWTPASDELDIGGTASTTRPGAPTLALSGFAVAGFEAGSGSAVYPSGRATWTTPVNPAIKAVTVEIRENGDNTTLQSLPTVRPGEGVITFGRLAPSTTYQARYILGDGEKTTNPSSWTSFTTTANDSSTTAPWSGVTGAGKPEDNATYGARAGVDLRDSGGSTLADADVKNAAITIGSDGTLSGAGGGQVTIGGLGFTGDLNATYGADWSATLTNRPTELTDGRITAALDSAGDLAADVRITQLSGTTKRSVGRSLGFIEAQDGDAITFAASFNTIPRVHLFGGKGLTYDTQLESGGSPVNMVQDYKPLNQTTSGFTVRAKIRGEASGTTAKSDSVATSGGGGAPDLVGDKSTADEAFDDGYTFAGTVSGTASAAFETVRIGVYTNDGSGWVQRGTVDVATSGSGSFSKSWEVTVTVDGLGQHAGQEFGVSIEFVDSGITGEALSSVTVSYDAAASSTEYTATPGSEKILAYIYESDEAIE
ncbi:hypothetical protein E5163_14955 [Marinicauda algicola]|uniref:Fibronectin type-III domain-containing protein n=1 Tax=Marinicauda algicola TaxID=2029849 RepID=A0A4S2GWB5_9PROT|nr:phage tail protein [Marinicauda algicola]TGY87365.1 hypothetical protein E5163_14955 [Marinicauda algicola]